ncbi:hypothetical protein STEG23_014219, partial [Scotinomys teguina]
MLKNRNLEDSSVDTFIRMHNIPATLHHQMSCWGATVEHFHEGLTEIKLTLKMGTTTPTAWDLGKKAEKKSEYIPAQISTLCEPIIQGHTNSHQVKKETLIRVYQEGEQ